MNKGKKIHIDRQFTAVKALIVNSDNKILLLRESSKYEDGTEYSKNKWWMPGGRVSIGESRDHALIREVKEESWLDILDHKPFYVGERYPQVRWEQRQILGVFFLCIPSTSDVKLGLDHQNYTRINPKDYTNYDILPPEDRVIQFYGETA